MLDFVSAHYLGMRHPSDTLGQWRSLTSGVPAALFDPPENVAAGAAVAALVGAPRGLLGPSTLHLFWDLFGALDIGSVHFDAALYPVARWAIERATPRGVPTRPFAHHDPTALRRGLRSLAGHRPVVVTDGFCPGCGRLAPLAEYHAVARARGGLLVIDDTQALGVLGAGATTSAWGRGGGGSSRAANLSGGLLIVASLAKAFGAPIAALAGDTEQVAEIEARGVARAHCSPPSVVAVRAAARALALNRHFGDTLRTRLGANVRRLRSRLAEGDVRVRGGMFPVQRLVVPPGQALRLQHGLKAAGVGAVLHRPQCDHQASVSLVVGAHHTPSEIDRAATSVIETLAGLTAWRRGCVREPAEMNHAT